VPGSESNDSFNPALLEMVPILLRDSTMKLSDAQRPVWLAAAVLFSLTGIFFTSDEYGMAAVLAFIFLGFGLFVFLSGDYKKYFDRMTGFISKAIDKLRPGKSGK